MAFPGAMVRVLRVAVGAAVVWAALTGTAKADSAGPTWYETTIVAVEPPVDGLELSIVGGDSFLRLRVEPGRDVTVFGYAGEPYLRFDRGGRVLRNLNSPATYLNEDRYATTAPPARADPDAPPDWVEIDDDGDWAWHDHRIHWMSSTPPLGLAPGAQVLDQRIDLVVDGSPVVVEVVSRWLADPSPVPATLGAAIGLLVGSSAVAGAVAVRRRGGPAGSGWGCRLPDLALVAASTAALTIGAWEAASLPSEARPPLTGWAMALVACVAALWATSARRPAGATAARTVGRATAARTVAAAELLIWSALRLEVLRAPVLATSAPFWLDRAVTAAVATVALVVAGTLVVDVVDRGAQCVRPAR